MLKRMEVIYLRSASKEEVASSMPCPREFSNSYLRRMIICFIVDNFELLWPMLHFTIKGNYGHLRLTTDQFREKERLGTLTDREREEYFKIAPFSVVTYLEQLMRPRFYGEEICLLNMSMMRKIKITVIKGQTLKPIKIHHRNPAMKVGMVLVHCNIAHYIPFCEFCFFFLHIHVKCVCIATGIYRVATYPIDVATSLYCIMTINHQFLLILCLQYRNMMQKTVKGILQECGLS